MPNDTVLDRIFNEIEDSGFSERVRHLVEANKRSLMVDGETPKRLLTTFCGDEHANHLPAAVLQLLLDESRMDVENQGGYGDGFLKSVENEIARLASAGVLGTTAIGLISSCYARANIDVPSILVNQRLADIELEMKQKPPTPPDLNRLIKNIEEEAQGDIYAVFEGLREMLAGFPAEATDAVIYEICSQDGALSSSLALYWLLDQKMSVREQAATAVLYRARLGKKDGALARQLPMVRSWMPADTARAIVDEVIREGRIRENKPNKSPAPTVFKEIQATPPDGVGCQSIAIVSKRKIGMILTKSGYGIKDAYVIPCGSDHDVQEILSYMHGLGSTAVETDALKVTVADALADGQQNGFPPASGLVDVVCEFGFEDVRPNSMSARDWLEFLDPEQLIAGMSPQKRGRLGSGPIKGIFMAGFA